MDTVVLWIQLCLTGLNLLRITKNQDLDFLPESGVHTTEIPSCSSSL